MDIQKKMGQRIKGLRKERELRQKDMSTLLDMTLRNYQRIEHGEINLPVSTLCILADYFGVSADYLLGRSEERLEIPEGTVYRKKGGNPSEMA